MKFSALLLAEHATTQVPSGLINVLNGGVSRLGRQVFPAPMLLYFVGIVELPADYVDDQPIGVEIIITSADDAEEVFARVNGSMEAKLLQQVDLRAATSSFVVDMRGVMLTKAGTYRLSATLEGTSPQSIFFQVVRTELNEDASPQTAQTASID